MAKTISLNDIISEDIEELEWDYLNMSDFYVDDYRDIMRYSLPVNIKWTDVSILDLFNIPLTTDDAIVDFIKKRVGIDITTSDGIIQINQLFEYAIDFYEKRYLRNFWVKIKKLIFKNAEWVINFLKDTKENKISWGINCSIAKISYAINDVLNNDKVRRENFLDKQFISEHLGPFQIEDGYEDNNWNIYRIWKVVIDDHIINFRLIIRQKTKNSIIWKQIADAKYYSIDDFKDLVWSTIYIEHCWHAALLMQYIDQMIYKWTAKITNKNWINLQAVKEWVYLNEEFYLKLEQETKVSLKKVSKEEKEHSKRKSSTSEQYKEIKLTWEVDLSLEEWSKSSKSPVWTEIKFVIWWHDNEKWSSLQTIYDYIKRFRELSRLWIPIRKIDIINYVNDFFENIDFTLEKKNKDKSKYYQELLEDFQKLWFLSQDTKLNWVVQNNEKILAIWLYKYFESKLKKVKIPGSKKIYYFDEYILNMRDIGLYKKIDIL